MRNNSFLLITMVSVLAALLQPVRSNAQILTIGSGSTLTINGSTLSLNCRDILISDGGSLQLQSGILAELGQMTVEPSGTYTYTSGNVINCGASSFYLLFTEEKKPIVILLPKR